MHASRLQSAMEYLITYGWAILLIMTVLAVLYELGIFSPFTFASKAPPGSCQVYRPYGPNTTDYINTEGPCNGQIPEFVARFNGVSSYASVSQNGVATPALSPNSVTVSEWIYALPFASGQVTEYMAAKVGSWQAAILSSSQDSYTYNAVFYYAGGPQAPVTSRTLYTGTWYNIAFEYNATSGVERIFVNGTVSAATTLTPNTPIEAGNGIADFGGSESGFSFDGYVSNIQVYNTSLDTNSVKALYIAGIGSDPINLQHIAGWWPMDGNTNDYSGQGLNATGTAIAYTGTWYNTYAAP